MKKISFVLCLLLGNTVYAGSLWHDIESRTLARTTQAKDYRAVASNHDALTTLLWAAPLENSGEQGALVELPLPDGSLVNVEVFESPVLSPELAHEFPDIKTFRAFGIDDPQISGRLDLTPNGFHAMLHTANGIVYINPESSYSPAAAKNAYRSLSKSSQDASPAFICKTPGHHHATTDFGYLQDTTDNITAQRPLAQRRFGNSLRTYRLALSATKEYSNAVASGNVNNTFSEMTTAINRVNGIYEKEVAVRLQLVSGTQLVSTNTRDFTDNDADSLLEENQAWIDRKLGSSQYDIGHVFSTGGGGLASIAAACDKDYKAQGVTGSSSPTGDTFYIDYVAHEIGHQLGATHTFNATNSGACDADNRQAHTFEGSSFLAASAYEPGSGSTIMAYAGICSPQNLQNKSDVYFHGRSIEQIRQFVDGDIASTFAWANGSRCGAVSSTGDTAPVANAGTDYTIPANTPFVLTGSATDADSDGSTFTYTWEQYDLGNATTSLNAMHTDQGSGPLIRSRTGTNNPQRFIPALDAILAGTLTAKTGERLPTTSRNLNFRLTVRSGSNGVSQDDMAIQVAGNAGPFRVTAPASGSYQGGNTMNVTWNVANTAAAPVNCAQVNIAFSSDGGNTFTNTLLANAPNNGSADVLLPNITSTTGRIRVACSNNIFFAVSPGNLTLTAATHFLSLSGTPAINEGNSGTVNLVFTVTLDKISANIVSAHYAVSGTGIHPANADDFGGNLPNGTISLAPGQLTQTLSIPVRGDLFTEYNETFTVTLSYAQHAAIIAPAATGTILNDDTAGTLNIISTDTEKQEGNTGTTLFTFTIERLGNNTTPASVNYAVSGSGSHPATADDFADNLLASGSVDLAAGETGKTLVIRVAGDKLAENNETFTVSISNPVNASIQNSSATGTILDDDTVSTTQKKDSGGGSNSCALFLLLLASGLYRRGRPENKTLC